MRVARALIDGQPVWVGEANGAWKTLDVSLDELLCARDFDRELANSIADGITVDMSSNVSLLAPIGAQEVWAAGVTYERSREARREEAGGADFYDRIYEAQRPEVFFKATQSRTVGTGDAVGIRYDSHWNVPEPELALVLNSALEIVGYTIGNDVSSRSIEGDNPLYLPQAKVYSRGLALGPVIVTVDEIENVDELNIEMQIERDGRSIFADSVSMTRLKRTLDELVDYLGRCNSFPHGAILLTGTGMVPPSDFSLTPSDEVRITIKPIGVLANTVVEVGSAGAERERTQTDGAISATD